MTTPRLPDAPTLRIGTLDWQRDAACAGEDLALFFGAEGERGFERALRERAVKRICARCPVREQCLQHALETGEEFGVWGGLAPWERNKIRRENRRETDREVAA